MSVTEYHSFRFAEKKGILASISSFVGPIELLLWCHGAHTKEGLLCSLLCGNFTSHVSPPQHFIHITKELKEDLMVLRHFWLQFHTFPFGTAPCILGWSFSCILMLLEGLA